MSPMPRNAFFSSILVLVFVMLHAPVAHAYLDPSTGSMIISALVGIFASIALALKTYWYRLKNLFRKTDDSKPAEDTSADS